MGSKNKLKRFSENLTFKNVIQPERDVIVNNNFKLKGNWNKQIFKNKNPIVVELGCGKGEYSVALAKENPEINYIGIDIKGARFWKGAKDAIENKLNNVVFLRTQIELIEKNDGRIVIDDEISKSVETIANQETVDIYLKHELHRDLYITLNKATPGIEGEPSTATITVREIPGIILVWIGSFLTILGMLMTMFTEWKNGRKILKKLAG